MSEIDTLAGEIHKIKSEWRPPKLSELPEKLDGLISMDLETKDDGIQQKQGPSWAWADGGRVVGYSFSADNWSGYLPIAHEGGGNLNKEKVHEIINKWLSNPNQAVAGANILYDLGWAKRDGIEVKSKKIYDVQWAEALLDEHRWGYSLDSLAKSCLNEGKDETLLQQAAAEWGLDAKSGLWQLPSMYVGPYAEADADRTRRVFLAQVPKLRDKNLWDLFELECSLLPLYLDMRWRGVRVDTDKAERLKLRWNKEVDELVAEIKRKTGVEVNLWAAASIAKALDTENIKYGLTEKSKKPSITKDWLEDQTHWLPKMILEARLKAKLSGTFIDGAILGHLHQGRIHTEFHPLRGESGGTISGRLSSSNPNLQQIPKRTKEGLLLRECFLPEEGEEWISGDYAQQEPRLTVHYAATVTVNGEHLPGAMDAVDKYIADPKMSYHKMVAEQTGLDYDAAKILNLALTYGMGAASAADALGVTEEVAKEYISKYHERLPYIKALDQVLKNKVIANGEIKTLLGRVCRFPMYEIADYKLKIKMKEEGKSIEPQPYWKAVTMWSGEKLQRAWMHKKLNRLIQGSAADQTKQAMKNILDAGLGKHVLLAVHDEICGSFSDRKDAERMAKIMEDAVKLKVPVIAELKYGPNWGAVKS